MFFMFGSIWNCWLTAHVSCFTTYRPEAHVIEEITFVIWKSLNQELLHVEKNLDGMDRQRVSFSSSSSSSSIGPSEYEDFLSFWDEDEDAKHNFIGHLYAALNRKWIRTFRINYLRGGDIALGLLHAIEKSRLVYVNLNRHALRPNKQYWNNCPRKLKYRFLIEPWPNVYKWNANQKYK